MNNFKEMLKVNSKRNTDEIIYGKFFLSINKICEKRNKQEDSKFIEQIESRKNGITQLFINYDRNMQKIYSKESQNNAINPNGDKQPNEIDKELQKIIRKSGEELYNKVNNPQEKVQILDRMTGTMKLLGNFDEYIKEIEGKQEDIQETRELA